MDGYGYSIGHTDRVDIAVAAVPGGDMTGIALRDRRIVLSEYYSATEIDLIGDVHVTNWQRSFFRNRKSIEKNAPVP